MDIMNLVAAQRRFFETGQTRDLAARRAALLRLRKAIRLHEEALCEALRQDLGKSAVESYMTEIGIVQHEIKLLYRKMRRWLRPRHCPTPLSVWPSRSRVRYEPLGGVLVIAPWNYPLQLSLLPLVGALAAGNCVVLKPSPAAPATAALLHKLISETFPDEYVAVVEHTPQAMDELLAQRFDHIFYTGGGAYAHRIMAAAAEHLTPVTLELGGKSPCIVGAEADLQLAARRIVWGKTLNAGQTCVAPDYLLVHESVCEKLLVEMLRALQRQWGEDPRHAADYPRMPDVRHARRVADLLATCGGRVVCGGDVIAEERYVAPTIILEPDRRSRLMQEEIFAPVLPVLTYRERSEVERCVMAGERPLALYYFGSERRGKELCEALPSGGVAINDVVIQVSSSWLPFGGVGASGMGRYHGRASLECFSNRRSYLIASTRLDLPFRYAPHPHWLLGWLRRIMG